MFKTKYKQAERIKLRASEASEQSLQFPAAHKSNFESADTGVASGAAPDLASAQIATFASQPTPFAGSLSNPKTASKGRFWIYAATIGLACFCAFGGSRLSQLGMDWGYYLVEKIAGQAHGGNQAEGAGILMILVAPVIYGTMTFSILKGVFRGGWRWQLFILPAFIACFAQCVAGHLLSLADTIEAAPYLIGMYICALALSLGFDRLYRELAKRVNAKLLLGSFGLAVLPAALIGIFGGNLLESHSLSQEIPLYSALLFFASFCAPLVIRARKQSAAFSAVLFASLPVLIFNFANIAFGMSCWLFGQALGLQLDWHAPLSSLLISTVTAISVVSGGALGSLAVRLRTARLFS